MFFVGTGILLLSFQVFAGVYIHDITEESLFNAVKLAENEIKIYIYNATDAFRSIPLKNSLKHFRSEYLFTEYLTMISKSTDHQDHRKNMIVTNPEHANTFLIDHRVFNGVFSSVDEMVLYIRAVIDRVVDELPYYNRNGGKDHYFFGVHSNGDHFSSTSFTSH
jgi:hypothetical protein